MVGRDWSGTARGHYKKPKSLESPCQTLLCFPHSEGSLKSLEDRKRKTHININFLLWDNQPVNRANKVDVFCSETRKISTFFWLTGWLSRG